MTKLNDLFYKGGDEVATSIGVESGELPRLPLFRVQWNALPGAREVYHARRRSASSVSLPEADTLGTIPIHSRDGLAAKTAEERLSPSERMGK